jgi:LacI family repressor for deo operon, udp, cdd, tsx, nupC, and nupG
MQAFAGHLRPERRAEGDMSWTDDGPPPKIGDVARRAGVSTATVSRALATPEKVTRETRDLVLKAVEEIGYVPNNAARNLRTSRTRTVLVVLLDITNVFFTRIIRGLSEILIRHGYSVIIAETAHDRERARIITAQINAGRVDGMLVTNGRVLSSLYDLRRSLRVPTVGLGEQIPGGQVPYVTTDNRGAADAMTSYLISLGHRRIAYVGGPEGNLVEIDRRAGYRAALERAGIAYDADIAQFGAFSLGSGEAAGRAMLTWPTLPDAVFCCSDTMAMGVIRVLTAAGVAVPHQVSVAGFDDIDFAEAYIPSLTTMRQDRATLGETAARMLVDLMEGRELQQPHLEIDAEIVPRESTTVRPPR